MTEELKARITALRDEIDQVDGAARAEVMAHLEQAVTALEAKGAAVPDWARARIAASMDELVEAQFDNMPV